MTGCKRLVQGEDQDKGRNGGEKKTASCLTVPRLLLHFTAIYGVGSAETGVVTPLNTKRKGISS